MTHLCKALNKVLNKALDKVLDKVLDNVLLAISGRSFSHVLRGKDSYHIKKGLFYQRTVYLQEPLSSHQKQVYPMKSVAGLLFTTVVLTGCSSNTVFDDNAYRAVGGSAPRREPQSMVIAKGQNEAAWTQKAETSLSTRQSDSQNPRQHLVRYGHPNIIKKIIQTARIHCQPFATKIQTNNKSYWGENQGRLQQCTYRFPKHCGNHQFAVIDYADKLVLTYREADSNHYIIDLISGTPAAKPGLWDSDDRISSTTNNMGYVLLDNYNTNFQSGAAATLHSAHIGNLGWIIQASYDDEAAHGKRYHQAVEDIVACF